MADFLETLKARCRARPGRLGLPECEEPRILTAARELLEGGFVAEIVFFGDQGRGEAAAKASGIDLARYGERVSWAKGGEGTVFEQAAQSLRTGRVDAVLAGAVATTAEVIRAGLSGVGLAEGVRTVSGSFLMNKPGGPLLLYADAAVVPRPTAKQLCDIAVESVKTWRSLVPEEPPRVAFLSFSTKGSARHAEVDRMLAALELFREACPDVEADGEMQFDAAFDPEIGRRKAPESKVAGRANCLIFPDLNAGNIAYKITQRLAGFEAYGPILQGLAKPYSDLSRGSTVADIVASAMANLLRRDD